MYHSNGLVFLSLRRYYLQSKTRRATASAFARSTSSADSTARTGQKKAMRELPPSALTPPPPPPPLAAMPRMMMAAAVPTMSTGQTLKVVTGIDQKSQMVTVTDRKSQMTAATAAEFLVRKRRRKGASGGWGRRRWERGVAGRTLRSGVWRNRKMRSWQCLRQRKGIDFVSRKVWLPARGGRRTPGGPPRGARRDAVLTILAAKQGCWFCVPPGAALCLGALQSPRRATGRGKKMQC